MVEPPRVQIELAVSMALASTGLVELTPDTRVKFELFRFTQGNAVIATILRKENNGDWNEVFHTELRTDQSQIANWEYELLKTGE